MNIYISQQKTQPWCRKPPSSKLLTGDDKILPGSTPWVKTPKPPFLGNGYATYFQHTHQEASLDMGFRPYEGHEPLATPSKSPSSCDRILLDETKQQGHPICPCPCLHPICSCRGATLVMPWVATSICSPSCWPAARS